MRPSVTLTLLCLTAALGAADWKEVWRDDFNGKDLDWTKWSAEENGHGGGNGELQYYLDRPENLRVEDGRLVIEARREPVNVAGTIKEYSSARIRTKRRAEWLYGRFEMSARLPAGRGVWPAFWMLPSRDHYGVWAASGEIDIMEFKGQEPDTLHTTLHFGGSWPHNRSTTKVWKLPKGDFTQDFHRFAVEWEKDVFRWYVDDTMVHELKEWHSAGAPFPAPFDRPFHLILNVAVGGGFAGPPDGSRPFPPARLLVDWVSVSSR